jgi:hypothetical protein
MSFYFEISMFAFTKKAITIQMSGGCRLEIAFWALNTNFLMKIIADFTLSVPKMVKNWKKHARILYNTILYLANVGLTIKLTVGIE